MRLKVRPEDFLVRELLSFDPDPNGEHYVHLLHKEKIDTLSALTQVARETGVARKDIAFAGLKDRQGITEQWISVRGRRIDLRRKGLMVAFRGRAARPITSKQSQGNAFRIVLRELTPADVGHIERSVEHLAVDGFSNYFDDQRFGSVRHGQGLVLRDLLHGDYEAALRGIVAAPSPRAITGDVKLKRFLAQHWGDWQACAAVARGPMYRRVFTALVRDPGDFRGALLALPERLKLIHTFAYQSYLWNRSVSRWLKGVLPRQSLRELRTVLGRLRTWSHLGAAVGARLRSASTPLFGIGFADAEPSFRAAVDAVLRREQIGIDDCAAHALAGFEMRAEPRPALVVPTGLRLEKAARGGKDGDQLTLHFSLPRGSYATMLIKCLTARPWQRRHRPPGRPDRGGER